VRSVLSYTRFAAHISHRGRVRLWQLRDEVLKGRTKEREVRNPLGPADLGFGRAIHLALKAQEKKSEVLFMDLNNFKPVNDTNGHDVGDESCGSIFRLCSTSPGLMTSTAGEETMWTSTDEGKRGSLTVHTRAKEDYATLRCPSVLRDKGLRRCV
jgi:hypothetical protein